MTDVQPLLSAIPHFEMPSATKKSPSNGSDYSDVARLFSRLVDSERDEERQKWRRQIIVACLPLADRIAYGFVGRGQPSEDLVQVARIGLIKTVDRYDPGKGNFLSFASTTISGEIRRHFRDNTWAMHVPRGIKDTHRRVRAALDPLSQRLGRTPTVAELAAELDVDREDISISMRASYAYQPTSLDAWPRASDEGDRGIGSRHGADDPRYNAIEETLALTRLIAELPRRQQMILKMRFCDCLTQTQIAQRLGISQVHVHRLLTATLGRLRKQLLAGTDSPGC